MLDFAQSLAILEIIARILSFNDPETLRTELLRIGVDPQAVPIFMQKRSVLTVKLTALPASAANILKQTALLVGADCAIHRDVIRSRKRVSDTIIFATRRQFARLVERLQYQPPAARMAGILISETLQRYEHSDEGLVALLGSRKTSAAGHRTCLMGILNVTPDSFSDGARYLKPEQAIAHGEQLVQDGADILDIGAESSRPGALPVSVREELSRLLPVLKHLRRRVRVPISIDTAKSKVADICLAEGAKIINDITGLRGDARMARVIARHGAGCVIMHMKGTPRTMQRNPRYRDLMGEIYGFLEQSLTLARRAGIADDRMIVDPGIGFGKTVEHNFEILRRLSELRSLGCPILVGPSRKSFIGLTLNLPVDERLEGTIAACVLAVANGARILRVHDVKPVKRAIEIAERILGRTEQPDEFPVTLAPVLSDGHSSSRGPRVL